MLNSLTALSLAQTYEVTNYKVPSTLVSQSHTYKRFPSGTVNKTTRTSMNDFYPIYTEQNYPDRGLNREILSLVNSRFGSQSG